MKNKLIISGIIFGLVIVTAFGIILALSIGKSDLPERSAEKLMINGEIYYAKRFVDAADEVHDIQNIYELGEITTTYDEVPSEHLQMSISEGTLATGTAYGDKNNEEVLNVYLTIDPTVDGKYYDTREPEYLIFVSQRLYDNYYLRFNGKLYTRSAHETSDYKRTTELPNGYIEGEKVFFNDMYSIPDEDYEVNVSVGGLGKVYYNPERPGRIYLFDYYKVTYNKNSNNTKEKSYSIWELEG